MAIKASTGLRNQLLTTQPLSGALSNGLIEIYSGTPPATADDAVTGTLLCTISVDSSGTGLAFDTAAVNGVLLKSPTQTWSGVNAASGTATYYRHVTQSDSGISSTTDVRIQGTIGVAGADMNMTSVNLVSGATQTVDYYSVGLPTF